MRFVSAVLMVLVLALLPCVAAANVGDAVDNTSLVWGTSSASVAPWFSQTAYTHDGVDAARSGAVGNSEQSDLTTTVTGPGTLTFWWKVSSQSASGYYDILYFWYDSSVGMSMIYGNVDWTQKTVEIPEGTHTLNWSYAKDYSGASGLDAGFLDQVVYTTSGGDTMPPGPVAGFHATAGDGEIGLGWTNPEDADLAGVRIQRSESGFPADETEGTTVFDGAGTSHTDSGLLNGRTYYYAAFAYDGEPNFSVAATASAAPEEIPPFQPNEFVTSVWASLTDAGYGDDWYYDAAFDKLGNLVVAGYQTESTGYPAHDARMVKFSHDGSVVLAQDTFDSADAASTDRFYGVCTDSGNNIITVGTACGTYPPYHQALLVRKYTPGGALSWEKRYSPSSASAWNSAEEVCVDAQDYIYVIGQDFGGWDTRQGEWCILKYSPEGNLQTGFPINYNYSPTIDIQDRGYGIAVDANGNICAVGVIGVQALLMLDWHVRLYNSSGALQWSDTIDGSTHGNDYALSTVFDSAGDLYVCGCKEENGVRQLLVVKYAGAGSSGSAVRLWEKTYELHAGKDGCAYAMTMGSDGNLLVAGYYQDPNGVNQGVLLRIHAGSGTLMARQVADGATNTYVQSVVAHENMIGTAGSFQSQTNYDFLANLSRLNQFLPDLWMIE